MKASRPEPVLVFGYGNPSRGDDALGPLIIEQLDALRRLDRLQGVDVLTDFQLQVEHVMDLIDRELVIFVDAAMAQVEPFRWIEVEPEVDASWSTHSLSPGALAGVYQHLYGPLPRIRLLSVGGERFELGAELSAVAASNLQAASAALLEALYSAGSVSSSHSTTVPTRASS
jgi:hydrogenase maturation protease